MQSRAFVPSIPIQPAANKLSSSSSSSSSTVPSTSTTSTSAPHHYHHPHLHHPHYHHLVSPSRPRPRPRRSRSSTVACPLAASASSPSPSTVSAVRTDERPPPPQTASPAALATAAAAAAAAAASVAAAAAAAAVAGDLSTTQRVSSASSASIRTGPVAIQSVVRAPPLSPAEWLRANEANLHSSRNALRLGYISRESTTKNKTISKNMPATSPIPITPCPSARRAVYGQTQHAHDSMSSASSPSFAQSAPPSCTFIAPPVENDSDNHDVNSATHVTKPYISTSTSTTSTSTSTSTTSITPTNSISNSIPTSSTPASTSRVKSSPIPIPTPVSPSSSSSSSSSSSLYNTRFGHATATTTNVPLSSSPSSSSSTSTYCASPPRHHTRSILSSIAPRVAGTTASMSSASPPSYCPVGLDLVDAGAELDARVYYLGPVARNKVIRALELARASKVPSHVLAENITVASIVADLQMDCETVCAAVLRTVVDVDDEVETVNATNASTVTDADNRAHKLGHNNYSQGCSAAEVEHACGADVVKILRLHAQLEESVRLCVDASFTELSFANLRELILVRAVEEHRAISLELARAVLAIRTVDALSDPKARLAVARRTMHLYAPLANQLGIWYVQSELEELAFMYLDPASFEMIRHLVGERRRECEDMLTDSKQLLERILSATPEIRKLVRTVRIKGRVKGLYSVYRKMRRTGKKVYEIYDLLALRVVVQPKKADDDAERAACYAVAQVIQQHYDTFQSRAKDYIAQPKRNGYRSVHMTVLPHGGSTPLEIQIRSEKMHHVAEFGAAAHWIYKESSNDENSADDNEDGKDDDLLEVDVDQQTGINADNDEELGAAYLDSDDDQSDSDSLYDYYYGYGAQLQSSDETVGAGPDLASDIDSDSDIEGANDKRTTQAAPAIAAFSPRDIRGNAGLMSPSSHDRPSDVDTCTTKAMRESHDATIKSSVVIDDDDDDDNDNNNLSNGNHRNRHSSTSSSSSTSTPTVHVNGGRSVRDATAKVKHTVINTSSSSYDQKTGKKKSKKSIKPRAHYAKDDGDNNSNTVTTKTATASTVVTTTKTATSTTGAKLRRRQSSRSTVSSYPRPRVAVKPQVVDPEAQRAHERLRALARQQQTVRGVAAQDMLQHELRGGYVTCLASAIRASRVIVATAGQLYGLAVGSTLMDLASRLGVATLGAIAVVNGQIVPLTQRLNMNDIVQFITL